MTCLEKMGNGYNSISISVLPPLQNGEYRVPLTPKYFNKMGILMMIILHLAVSQSI